MIWRQPIAAAIPLWARLPGTARPPAAAGGGGARMRVPLWALTIRWRAGGAGLVPTVSHASSLKRGAVGEAGAGAPKLAGGGDSSGQVVSRTDCAGSGAGAPGSPASPVAQRGGRRE